MYHYILVVNPEFSDSRRRLVPALFTSRAQAFRHYQQNCNPALAYSITRVMLER